MLQSVQVILVCLFLRLITYTTCKVSDRQSIEQWRFAFFFVKIQEVTFFFPSGTFCLDLQS